jgi:hypothetical protein
MRSVRRGGEPVLVETYAGRREEERPLAVLWNLRRHEVAEVLSEQLVEPVDRPGARKRRFTIRTSEGLVLRVEHELLADCWRVTAALRDLDRGPERLDAERSP